MKINIREKRNRVSISPLIGSPNQNLLNNRMTDSTEKATKTYAIVFPIMISWDLMGEINMRSIDPDSFSLDILRDVNNAEIIMSRIAIIPGIKK